MDLSLFLKGSGAGIFNRMHTKIAICCGEVSGDEHAAKLVKALQECAPGAEFRGMGGRHSRAAGVTTVVDSEASASAMGFIELFSQLGKIRSALREMKKLLREWRPEVLVVIDFPDFNFILTKYAKKLGIKTVYFIIPKMWAWRSGRIKHFKRYIDHAACIFPFESKFCRAHGYEKVTYVGHPFATEFDNLASFDRSQFITSLGLNPSLPVVALFPGSRRGELKRHLTPMIEGFEELRQRYPNVQGIIPLPGTINPEQVRAALPNHESIALVNQSSIEVLRAADFGLIKSGTSNLQASFCELPFIMFFSASRLTEFIVTTFVKLKHYSIVNILRHSTVLELIQEEVNPKRIASELEQLLIDPQACEAIRTRLREVNGMLRSFEPFAGCTDQMNPYQRTALIALSLLADKRSSANTSEAAA